MIAAPGNLEKNRWLIFLHILFFEFDFYFLKRALDVVFGTQKTWMLVEKFKQILTMQICQVKSNM